MKTAAKCAAVFVVATAVGTGFAAADPKMKTVMLDNGFPVDVRVTYEGYSKMSGSFGYQKNHTGYRLGDIPEQTTLKWVAVPEPGQDSTFKSCRGSWTITSSTIKVVLISTDCVKAEKNEAKNNRIEVTLINDLSEELDLQIGGTDASIHGRHISGGSSHPVGKALDGDEVAWKANTFKGSKFEICLGQTRVSTKVNTIHITASTCSPKGLWHVQFVNRSEFDLGIEYIDHNNPKVSGYSKVVQLPAKGPTTIDFIPQNNKVNPGIMVVLPDGKLCDGSQATPAGFFLSADQPVKIDADKKTGFLSCAVSW
jgi:hypothetical protein